MESAAKTSRPKVDFVEEAMRKNDWEQAYLLIEQALVSEDLIARYTARNLVERFPGIRKGALESFSTENLVAAYKINPDLSPSIQWKRLSIYQRTIATPEQHALALRNYKMVYGDGAAKIQSLKNQPMLDYVLIHDPLDNELAKELHDAVSEGRVVQYGKTQDLLDILIPGKTERKDVLALIGNPSGRFELNSILTWPFRIENEKYRLLSGFIRDQEGVTHSLVLQFDKKNVLVERTLVKVVK